MELSRLLQKYLSGANCQSIYSVTYLPFSWTSFQKPAAQLHLFDIRRQFCGVVRQVLFNSVLSELQIVPGVRREVSWHVTEIDSFGVLLSLRLQCRQLYLPKGCLRGVLETVRSID